MISTSNECKIYVNSKLEISLMTPSTSMFYFPDAKIGSDFLTLLKSSCPRIVPKLQNPFTKLVFENEMF
jgi:hypothetical protein